MNGPPGMTLNRSVVVYGDSDIPCHEKQHFGQYPVDELFRSSLEAVDLKATVDFLVGAHDRFTAVPPAIL